MMSKCEKNEGAILSQSIADIIVRLHIDFYNYYYLYLFGLLERFVVFSILLLQQDRARSSRFATLKEADGTSNS